MIETYFQAAVSNMKRQSQPRPDAVGQTLASKRTRAALDYEF